MPGEYLLGSQFQDKEVCHIDLSFFDNPQWCFFLEGISGRQWGPPIAILIGMDHTYIIPDMLLDSGTPAAPLVNVPITSRPPLAVSGFGA